MLAVSELINILNTVPVGYKSPDEDFFVAANEAFIPKFKKLGVITTDDELQDETTLKSTEYFCNVPGCQLIFQDATAYQTHFNNLHRYLCFICRRSLPTAHLLDLHVSERHDSYFATLVERGKAMYACLLEECKQTMLTQEQRKDHCISVHKFPSNYRFEQLCGKANNKKNERNTRESETANPLDSMAISEITSNPFASKTFSFGHPKEKTFKVKTKSRIKHSFNDMVSLNKALEEI
ncbi:protein lethal(2)k10201 [Eurosta solidaginis]|uniref:protein lethal(2)k10201 n=1 Tax=Eurosta solidaginis TaxID=178769 RepID=UPI003530B926